MITFCLLATAMQQVMLILVRAVVEARHPPALQIQVWGVGKLHLDEHLALQQAPLQLLCLHLNPSLAIVKNIMI